MPTTNSKHQHDRQGRVARMGRKAFLLQRGYAGGSSPCVTHTTGQVTPYRAFTPWQRPACKPIDM